eukprot:m.209260 g.209260  ORF g.209260 m.209260 type:complete len:280 (-) comp15464_c0_seq8:948-1787(-)
MFLNQPSPPAWAIHCAAIVVSAGWGTVGHSTTNHKSLASPKGVASQSLGATAVVRVDTSVAGAAFDFEYGVDHGPRCDSGVDVADDLLRFGSSLIRTHDSGVLDWPVVYPHPNFDAPTDDPASYVWDAADVYWGNIVDSGLEPYLRLGTSWGQLGGGLPPAGVPYNRTALVDVLLHTVKHYREGWGGGRNFSGTSKFRYTELWNEPDSAVTGTPHGRFWNRSAADFYDLIHDTAVALKTLAFCHSEHQLIAHNIFTSLLQIRPIPHREHRRRCTGHRCS